MSGRLRLVLIAGCAVLSALHVGEARATLAQGLWSPYAEGAADAQRSADRAGGGSGSASLSRSGAASDVALRELEPFLNGLGIGL